MKKENLKRATDTINEIEMLEAHAQALDTHNQSGDVYNLRLDTDSSLNTFHFQNILLDETSVFKEFLEGYYQIIKRRVSLLEKELESL